VKEEFWGKPIYVYTSEEAVADGILFDLDTVLTPSPRASLFSSMSRQVCWRKATSTADGSLNVANLRDLLNQALRVFRKKREGDYFACGVIELPSGSKQKIFIAQNESGRYTVMLPEDY
jgi:predicted  nucleic acid-binding Zn-ribbon protein